jgi:CHASE1-domain containing sensor protein
MKKIMIEPLDTSKHQNEQEITFDMTSNENAKARNES